jgi:hypothetical protein
MLLHAAIAARRTMHSQRPTPAKSLAGAAKQAASCSLQQAFNLSRRHSSKAPNSSRQRARGAHKQAQPKANSIKLKLHARKLKRAKSQA